MELLDFRETASFTQRVIEYLGDESYAQLQWYLLNRPDAGDLIRASGGIRKLRWTVAGKGKRGGARYLLLCLSARRILHARYLRQE
jgi:hypothetical protein